MMELKHRPCPLCNSTDPSQLFMESNYAEEKMDGFSYSSRKIPEAMHLRMLLCGACDLLYASPAPPQELLESAYRQAAFDSGEEAGFAAQTYIRLLSAILPKLPNLDGALDIGTGDGIFLERLLGKGFTKVQGAEPSEAPIQSAKPHIRPLIVPGVFKPESFAEESFSLVTSFQTLEHVENPRVLLESVLPLLKPGGAFVTVSHNFRSLSARVMGDKSPIYDIEHLQLFSLKSMTKLLGQCGFTEISVRPVANTYPLHYWLKMLPLGTLLKKRLIGYSKLVKLGYWPVPLRAGNMLAIAYKK
jgi:SAM-dependent methyltransferase